MVTRRACLGLWAIALSLAACGNNSETSAFVGGLDPLEPNLATAPQPDGADRYPERFNYDRSATNEYESVYAHGYIHAPLSAVFRAFQDAAVTADRRRISSFSVTPNSEPMFPFSYKVHNVVNDIVTVEFDVNWRLGPTAGTNESPTAFRARYQKTFGSSFIDVLGGSVEARVVDANTTEVELIRHLRATGQSADDAEQTVRDMIGSAIARVHGRPLPTY